MKKILFTMLMLIVSCVMYAGSPVKSGNKKFLKDEGTVQMVFDWKNAKYDKKKPLTEYWEKDDVKYEQRVEDAESNIIKGFNEKSKKLKAVTTSGADYTMTIKIENLDYYFSVMGWAPGHVYKIWATVTVTDKTGATVCEMHFDEFKGGRDFVPYDAYTEMAEDFGKELAK